MRNSQHTVLAIETAQGEVFGSFTSSPWRANGNRYYGSCDAFVWNLRKSRLDQEGADSCRNLDEYILRESSLEVFKWNARDGNRNVQLLNAGKLFVGGGDPEVDENDMSIHTIVESKDNNAAKPLWGMALALDKELLRGTSSPCATFGSTPLVDKENSGSEVFDIMNIEIWVGTPHATFGYLYCADVDISPLILSDAADPHPVHERRNGRRIGAGQNLCYGASRPGI